MSTAFSAGQEARKQGKPITENPYPRTPFTPDDYPGNHALWADGWMTQGYRMQHDEARK